MKCVNSSTPDGNRKAKEEAPKPRKRNTGDK